MNEEKLQKKLAKRIKYLRIEKGLTNYELAYESAVPLTTLMHILDGTTMNPGVFTVLKICDGLGVSISEFFDTDDFHELKDKSQK